MWRPRHDEADVFLTATGRISSRDEYRHLLCYGVFASAATAAHEIVVETIRSITATPYEKAHSLIDAIVRKHRAMAATAEARIAYIRRFKAKKIINGEKRVTERLVYSRCFVAI
jgi:hypothetical protein